MGKVDFAYQTLRKLHKATMPVLKDVPHVGHAMHTAGKVMDSFEKTRAKALDAGNVVEEVVGRAKKAVPGMF